MKNIKILLPAAAIAATCVVVPTTFAASAMAAQPVSPSGSTAPATPQRGQDRIANGPLDGVYMTHDPIASCTTSNPTQMSVQYHCTNVTSDFAGDSVFVHVPNNHFSIDVIGRSMPNAEQANLITTLRDYLDCKQESKWGDHTYDGSEVWSSFLGWGVGAESEGGPHAPMDVTITVARTS